MNKNSFFNSTICNAKNSYKIILFFIFLWYIFQLIYFATTISYGIPPDEIRHHDVSYLYNNSINIVPENKEEYFYLGNLHIRPFYYIVSGAFLNLNVFSLNSYLFLRLFNIIISICTFYITYLIVINLIKDLFIRLGILIVLSNILMFNFLASSINYDNLINFYANLSFLLMIKIDKNTINIKLHILLLAVITLAGTLTKISYLPLALIEFICILYIIKNKKYRKKILDKLNSKEIVASIFVIILLSFNILYYGYSLINYNSLEPTYNKVIVKEQIIEIPINNYKVYEDLENSKDNRLKISMNQYFYEWLYFMEARIFGIFAHKNMEKNRNNIQICVFNVSLLLFSIFYIFKKIPSNRVNITDLLLIISFFYIIVVFLYVNYPIYLSTHEIAVGLQGRYIFPVFFILLIIIYRYLFSIPKLKIALIIANSILFIEQGFIYFIRVADSSWKL